MNGRVYDYNIGRFLGVDPFIQAPGNSQSINPYSYIMNNPMSGTDPTGYIASRWRTSQCDLDNSCPATLVDKALSKYLSPHIESGQQNEMSSERRKARKDTGKDTELLSKAETKTRSPAGADHKLKKINEDWKENGNIKVNDDGTIEINLTVSGYRNEYAASDMQSVWDGSKAIIDGKEYTVKANIQAVTSGGDIRINKMKRKKIKRLRKKTDGKMPGGYADFGSSKMELTVAATVGTAAHEFGHMLGMSHAGEESGSIMSYDNVRTVTNRDIELIVKGYSNE